MKTVAFVSITVLVALIALFIISSFTPRGSPPTKGAAPTPTAVQVIISPKISSPLSNDSIKQIQADKNFSKEVDRIYKKYPWYGQFPIQTDNYFVYFDIEKGLFVAKIYDLSNNLTTSQVDAIKTTIQTRLSALGVDLSQYKIEWKTGL